MVVECPGFAGLAIDPGTRINELERREHARARAHADVVLVREPALEQAWSGHSIRWARDADGAFYGSQLAEAPKMRSCYCKSCCAQCLVASCFKGVIAAMSTRNGRRRRVFHEGF